jgi:hypothetical protein
MFGVVLEIGQIERLKPESGIAAVNGDTFPPESNAREALAELGVHILKVRSARELRPTRQSREVL